MKTKMFVGIIFPSSSSPRLSHMKDKHVECRWQLERPVSGLLEGSQNSPDTCVQLLIEI